MTNRIKFTRRHLGKTALAGATLTPGSSTVISNSQCTVNGALSQADHNGLQFTLTLNIGLSSSFSGNRVFYLAARDVSDTNNSGWQPSGSWMR